MVNQRQQKAVRGQSPVFSEELHAWLTEDGSKSLAGLNQLFGEKTFAIAFLLLMALPALPLPTGGITHVTEMITMLLCLELIAGRKSIWLPKRWLEVDVGKVLTNKAVRRLIAFIEWFERRSRRRWRDPLARTPVLSLVGFVVLAFAVAAFLAPPFSGLDTLPAFGAIIIALGLILEDGLVVLAGTVVGIVGIVLEITAGAALYEGLRHLFKYV